LSDQEHSAPYTLDALAHAYQVAGRTDLAIAAYQKFVGMPEPPLGWEPQQAWVRAHVELASLYKESSENAKASALLTEFLGLWKDADPDLSLLKEARQLEEQLAQ
jgi:tetratricopeptide (TPR) repeat protein